MEEQNDYSIFPEEAKLVYAPFWWRLGAAFIDGLILLIPNYILTHLLNDNNSQYGWGDIASLVFAWLYFASYEAGPKQATVGKRTMGIKVVNEHGNRISFGQATGRYFGKYISAIILLIGYLMMLWDARKQTLHDKLAATFVVFNQNQR